jgi:C-terminal processing protease CtpA/Prc
MYEDPMNRGNYLENSGDFNKFDLWRELGLKILNECEHMPLVIKNVRPGSWAETWGVSRGDVILQIGDDTLSQTDRLTPDETMQILWLLGDEYLEQP